jgi:hypothetical protein
MQYVKLVLLITGVVSVWFINWFVSRAYFSSIRAGKENELGKPSAREAFLTLLYGFAALLIALPVPFLTIPRLGIWALGPAAGRFGLCLFFSWLLPTAGIFLWNSRRA